MEFSKLRAQAQKGHGEPALGFLHAEWIAKPVERLGSRPGRVAVPETPVTREPEPPPGLLSTC